MVFLLIYLSFRYYTIIYTHAPYTYVVLNYNIKINKIKGVFEKIPDTWLLIDKGGLFVFVFCLIFLKQVNKKIKKVHHLDTSKRRKQI